MKVGPYDVAEPTFAGTTFEFTMRDRDGLPVVNEVYNDVERIVSFRAELVRISDSQAKPTQLPLQFVGNKQMQNDGTWEPYRGQLRPPRSRHGRVEVVVQLANTGLHYVYLYGSQNMEPTSTKFEQFTWRVQAIGECNLEEQERDDMTGSNGTRDESCACRPGFYRPEPLPGQLLSRCRICAKGEVKDIVSDAPCTSCVERNTEVLGQNPEWLRTVGLDPNRRETVGEGEVDFRHHDKLSDCGCSASYVLRFSDLRPSDILQYCPKASSIDTWRRDCPSGEPCVDAGRFARYRRQCCVPRDDGNSTLTYRIPSVPWTNGTVSNATWSASSAEARCNGRNGNADIESQWAFTCVERACREEYLSTTTLAIEGNDTSPALCVRCDDANTDCNAPADLLRTQPGLTVRSLPIRPGYWRTNEHSTEVRQCFPTAACNGTSRAANCTRS